MSTPNAQTGHNTPLPASKTEYKVRYAISKADRGFKTFERQADAWTFYDEKCVIAEAVVELIQIQTTVIARKESEGAE